jgi:aquaporin Z
MTMDRTRAIGAEALGTYWLVLGGCGSAVLAANFGEGNTLGIGLLGVSFAFGLTVLTGAYALGHISGGHFNPAVTIGLWTAKKFPAKDIAPYVAAQVVGAILASITLWGILEGRPGFETSGNWLAANGFGDSSPGGFTIGAALIAEVVLTALFLVVILGITDRRAPAGFAPMGIGLCLTLIHLISIPVTNTSVNPARSTGPALLVGGENLEQLWFFWLAPIVGGVIGALIHGFVSGDEDTEEVEIS